MDKPIPISLKIIAYLLIFFGSLAILKMVTDPFFGRISIEFGFVQLFVGMGLLKLKSSSRIWALLFVYLNYIFLLITGYFSLILPYKIKLFGVVYWYLPAPQGILICFLFLILNVWENFVLHDRKIKHLFENK
jgi:hypothetical protein